MEIIIRRSKRDDKKFDAIIDDKEKISFGARGMSDYTIHKDKERKNRYLERHKNDNYNNILYPSFFSNNLLWNKPTLNESIKDTNKRFKNIKIKLKRA